MLRLHNEDGCFFLRSFYVRNSCGQIRKGIWSNPSIRTSPVCLFVLFTGAHKDQGICRVLKEGPCQSAKWNAYTERATAVGQCFYYTLKCLAWIYTNGGGSSRLITLRTRKRKKKKKWRDLARRIAALLFRFVSFFFAFWNRFKRNRTKEKEKQRGDSKNYF